MDPVQLTTAQLQTLQQVVNEGNAAAYYGFLATNGHDYGNLALQAATDTGFFGLLANNYLLEIASEYNVTFDRTQLMRNLMQADLNARIANDGWPVSARTIRDYHFAEFEYLGIPRNAWTGTIFDNRMGAAAWCAGCNEIELGGQTIGEALLNLGESLRNEFNGTVSDFAGFLKDLLLDNVFLKTVAEWYFETVTDATLRALGLLFEALIPSAYGGEISPDTRFDSAQRILPRRDPLILDLDGDGLETVGVAAGVLFDHDGDGVRSGTGWVSGDDGFLVLDRNGNGQIDNGRELFGDSTPLAAGGTALDGFAALAQEDTNADGRVDSLDANWSNLRVWRDLNQDGVSQAGELFTLGSLGITARTAAGNRILPVAAAAVQG